MTKIGIRDTSIFECNDKIRYRRYVNLKNYVYMNRGIHL